MVYFTLSDRLYDQTAGDKQNNECTTLRASRVQQATTVCDNENVTCVLCLTKCVFKRVLEFAARGQRHARRV